MDRELSHEYRALLDILAMRTRTAATDRAVIVAVAPSLSLIELGKVTEQLAIALAPHFPDVLVGRERDHMLWLVPTDATTYDVEVAFVTALNSIQRQERRISAGIGSPGVDLVELQTSYRRALETVDFLEGRPDLPAAITYRHAALYRAVNSLRAMYLADSPPPLDALAPDGAGDELLATFEALLDDVSPNVSAAAQRVGVDRRTVGRHMERIAKLTDLSLHSRADMILAQLELWVMSVERAARANQSDNGGRAMGGAKP